MPTPPLRFQDQPRNTAPVPTDIIVGTNPYTGQDVHYTMTDVSSVMRVLLSDALLTPEDRVKVDVPTVKVSLIYRYFRGNTAPSVDVNNADPGPSWVTTVGTGTSAVWRIDASANNGVFVPPWSAPVKLTGEAGLDGIAGTDGTAANQVFFQADGPSTVGRKLNDTWWKTSSDPAENLKQHRWNGTAWVEAFAPFLTTDSAGRVMGLNRVGETGKTFCLVADKFQIWDGVAQYAPFEIIAGQVAIRDAAIRQLAVAKLIGGTIVSQEIILQGLGAVLRSGDFVTGVSGWKIDGEGAEFPALVVRSAQIEADAVTRRYGANFPYQMGLSAGTWHEVAGLDVVVELGNTAQITVSFGFGCANTTTDGAIRLLRADGSVVISQDWTARSGNTELISYTFQDTFATTRFRLEVTSTGGTFDARGPTMSVVVYRK